MENVLNNEERLQAVEDILQYRFEDKTLLLTAITHPSAIDGHPYHKSYERLEFLGDSILGAIVAQAAFEKYKTLDEGGLTRIKVALVSGSSLSAISQRLGLADLIIFGSSETGTAKRGLHSALENVYEALVAALFIDGGIKAAAAFVKRTVTPMMSLDLASVPENPKSALQERMQEAGVTPTYRLIESQGPPHDRTFVSQVYAGETGLACGEGRTKKEAESVAARKTLERYGDYFDEDGTVKPFGRNANG